MYATVSYLGYSVIKVYILVFQALFTLFKHLKKKFLIKQGTYLILW